MKEYRIITLASLVKPRKVSIICIALTSLLFVSTAFADNQDSFVRKVAGGGSVSQSIQTTDGNYISISNWAPWVVRKVTPLGKMKWERTLSVHVSEGGYWRLLAITEANDGYILVGEVTDNDSSYSAGLVVALQSDGSLNWSKRFDISGNLAFDSVTSTLDGGFIVTGGAYPPSFHPILVKFTSGGNIQWLKAFETLSYPLLSQSVSDYGLVLVARSSNGANVIKINDSGNIIWAVTLEMEQFSHLHALTGLSDKGILLAGNGTNRNTLLLVYLNADGTLRSKAAYSLNVPSLSISSLVQTPDGGVAIGGSGFLMKINDRQNLIFLKRLRIGVASVIAKDDGSYLLFGSLGKDTLFVGLNNKGIVPGCSFSHQLSASKVPFGKLKHQKLTVTTSLFGVTTGGSLNVTSKRLNRPISDVCGNSQSNGGCL